MAVSLTISKEDLTTPRRVLVQLEARDYCFSLHVRFPALLVSCLFPCVFMCDTIKLSVKLKKMQKKKVIISALICD